MICMLVRLCRLHAPVSLALSARGRLSIRLTLVLWIGRRLQVRRRSPILQLLWLRLLLLPPLPLFLLALLRLHMGMLPHRLRRRCLSLLFVHTLLPCSLLPFLLSCLHLRRLALECKLVRHLLLRL